MVPAQNIKIYKLLFFIEVGLRELIIDTLGVKFGELWWKTRLPPDVLKSFRDGRSYEKSVKWSEIIPHHPIYYIDFPDLKKIIQKSDNWQEAFQPLLKNKDVIVTTLSELEPIRNKIAHNRNTSDSDLTIVEAAKNKLSSAVGEHYFSQLASRCTLTMEIGSHFSTLQAETKRIFDSLKRYEVVEVSNADKIMQNWWFDEDYLDLPIGGIKAFFETVHAYSKLPRTRGSGHKIARWITDAQIAAIYEKAMSEYTTILERKERL